MKEKLRAIRAILRGGTVIYGASIVGHLKDVGRYSYIGRSKFTSTDAS